MGQLSLNQLTPLLSPEWSNRNRKKQKPSWTPNYQIKFLLGVQPKKGKKVKSWVSWTCWEFLQLQSLGLFLYCKLEKSHPKDFELLIHGGISESSLVVEHLKILPKNKGTRILEFPRSFESLGGWNFNIPVKKYDICKCE